MGHVSPQLRIFLRIVCREVEAMLPSGKQYTNRLVTISLNSNVPRTILTHLVSAF